MAARGGGGGPRVRRLAVMGARGVGKTAITTRFISQRFNEKYTPTINDSFSRTVTVDGQDFKCEVFDSAGQDQYSTLPAQLTIGVDGYLLCFSVRDSTTLELAQGVYEKALFDLGLDKFPVVLVGNQIDAVSDRSVSKQEAEQVAKSLGCLYMETSAKQDRNVLQVFECLVKEIERSQQDPDGLQDPGQEQGIQCAIV